MRLRIARDFAGLPDGTSVRSLQFAVCMVADEIAYGSYTRDDGFGTRRLADDRGLGPVEILDLTPALATPAAEQAIRERAEQLDSLRAPMVAPVYRVDRTATGVSVVGMAPDVFRWCEVLAALEFGHPHAAGRCDSGAWRR